MTSLASQLKQLQIPGLQQVVGKVSHVSILFDKEVASTLDMESIFNIGVHGFSQLVSIDSVFLEYEEMLFSQKSLHLQRIMESKDVNKKIDKTIREFLMLVSPYLQLQAAKKCLEWLVWRFQIQNFNRDSLMMCILPYHETQIFSRIIQHVHTISYGTVWEHLLSRLKKGGTINTQTLITHCHSNINLLSFVFDMTEYAVKLLKKKPKSGFQMTFSFYSRILCGVINEGKLKIDLVTKVMSMIENGLQSNCHDFVCGTYMAVTMFISNSKLKSKVKKSLMVYVIKSMETQFYEYGLMCLLSIVQLLDMKTMPEVVCFAILELDQKELIQSLGSLQKKYEIDRFISLVLQALCVNFNTKEPECTAFTIKQMVQELELSTEMISEPCNGLIDVFVKLDEDVSEARDELARLIKIISRRFSLVFDECINKKFKEYSEDKTAILELKKLAALCLSNGKSHVIADAELPLVICLNHPESQLRLAATAQLFEIYKSDVFSEEPSFFKATVLARLKDDEPAVVKECLRHPKSLLKILSKEDVHQLLDILSERADDTYNLSPLYMRVLQDVDTNNYADQKLFYMTLAQVFTSIPSKKSSAVFRFFQDKEYNLDNHVLNAMKDTLQSCDKKMKNNSSLLELQMSLVEKVADSFTFESFQNLWEFQANLHKDHILRFLSVLILLLNTQSGRFTLEEAIPLMFSRELHSTLEAEDFLNEDPLQYMLGKFFNDIKINNSFDVSLTVICSCFFIKAVICKLIDSKKTEMKNMVFKLIGPYATAKENDPINNVCRLLIKLFFQTCFPSKNDVRCFVVQLCIQQLINPSKMLQNDLRVALSSLSIIGLFLERASEDLIEDLEIGLHLSLLSFPHKIVRQLVCENFEKYTEVIKPSNQWSFILNLVAESSNEIVVDASHAKRVFEKTMVGNTNQSFGRQRKNDFDLFKKKESSKKEKKQEVAFEYCIACLVTWPVSISTRVLDVIELSTIPNELLEVCLKSKEIDNLQEGSPTLSLYKQLIINVLKKSSDATPAPEVAVSFIIKCLEMKNNSLLALILEKLDKQQYGKLSETSQLEIVQSFFNLLKVMPHTKMASNIRITLKELPIKTEHICKLLSRFVDVISDVSSKKKDKELKEHDFKLHINDLEELLLAVGSQKILDHENVLVTSLFSVLERCLLIPGTEFLKQLCLNFLTNLTRQTGLQLNFHCFKVEFLLDCLRSTNDPQTQENCLQLISSTAVLFPHHILHSVMHVFAFMGGTFLKLDNEHTFNVIKKTIHTILPAILQVKEKPSKKRMSEASVEEVVLDAIQAFVSSCPYCPEHRRQFILQELLTAVGIKENLGNTVLLLIKLISTESSDAGGSSSADGENSTDVIMKDKTELKNMYSSVTLDFSIHFFSLYEVSTQLSTINQMIRYLTTLSIKKENASSKKRGTTRTLFDTNAEGEKKSRLFIYTVVSFIEHVLKRLSVDQHLQALISSQKTFLMLTEAFIQYADNLEKVSTTFEAGSLSQLFIKKLLTKTCLVMEISFRLLPFTSYMELLAGLIQKTQIVLKKKAFELLAKVLRETDKLDENEEDALLALTPIIQNEVTKLQNRKNPDPNTLQLQLFTMKLIVIRVSGNHPELFLSWLPIASSLYTGEKADDMVSINAMLLCKELVALLKIEVLPHLNDIVPPMIVKLAQSLESIRENKDTLLLVTCIISLQKIFVSIPQFMSPYITSLFDKVSEAEAIKSTLNKDTTTLNDVINKFKTDLGQKVAPRILCPIVRDMVTTNTEDEVNINTLATCLDIFSISLDKMTSAEINDVFRTDVVSLFQMLLQRAEKGGINGNVLEEKTIDTFCRLALRMTEKSLRNVYGQLFKWATTDNIGLLTSRKMLSFYRLSVAMSTKLQGLFLLFVHDVMEKSSDVLSELTKDESDNVLLSKELLISVIDCYTSIFRYDTHGYMNRERFQMVVHPIVQQIETKLFEEEEFKKFCGKHLEECIVSLASAVNDPVCWKTLNVELLNRTKSDSTRVRIGVLLVIEKIYDKLGESYMVLVPETIPYLSEVLEDESVEVEEICRGVIKKIEQITGESIQKYF